MIRLRDRRSRWLALLLLIGVGLVVGFAATRLGPRPEPEAAVISQPPVPPPPAARGSSLSVVGGMTPEEASRLGIRLPEEAPPAGLSADLTPPVAAPITPTPAGIVSVSGLEGDGPPIASGFSVEVQQAATRYLCLCGCPHGLAECPCRDQPIGAGTMLTYLEKQLRAGASGRALDAAMIDRYGERVVVPGTR